IHALILPVCPGAGGSPAFVGVPELVMEHQVSGSRIALTREKWIELLRSLRFTDVLVSEFPVRLIGAVPSPRLQAARVEIEEARHAFHDHRYDDVAVRSRRALDVLVDDAR